MKLVDSRRQVLLRYVLILKFNWRQANMGNQLVHAPHEEEIQQTDHEDPFTNVAQDIKFKILFSLGTKDIISLSYVSKTWYYISSEGEM